MKGNFNESKFFAEDNRTKYLQNTKCIIMGAMCYVFHELV
jgi:hypothetical protein